MANITTLTQVASGMSEYYDRVFLERALPYLPHALFGQMRPLPSGTSTNVKFRKFSSLSKALVKLSEGVTPTAQQLSVTDITATPYQYGSYIEYSDKVTWQQPDQIITEATELCGENMAETLDTAYRDILNAGTTVFYAGSLDTPSIDSRAEVDEEVTVATLRACINTLRNNKAKYFTEMIKGGNGYATYPIPASFWGIAHPDVIHDLEGLTGWKDVSEYASHTEVMENEVGSILQIRFVMSTEAKVFDSAGVSSLDVYSTLIFAKNAYGIVSLEGHGSEIIMKELGSGGTSDALNQRGTVGWKALTTAKILNEDYMLRLESLAML